MPAKNRVNVGISRPIHETFSHMVRLFGKDVQEAADEAVRQWISRNAKKAKAKSEQVLAA